jgi:hypothetical protein
MGLGCVAPGKARAAGSSAAQRGRGRGRGLRSTCASPPAPDAEARHGPHERAAAVFERGVAAAPYCVDLWAALLAFHAGAISAGDQPDALDRREPRGQPVCSGSGSGPAQPGIPCTVTVLLRACAPRRRAT